MLNDPLTIPPQLLAFIGVAALAVAFAAAYLSMPEVSEQIHYSERCECGRWIRHQWGAPVRVVRCEHIEQMKEV